MTRIGDSFGRMPIRSATEGTPAGEIASTPVLDHETTLRQVAERLKLLLDLLSQLNPQIQDPESLQPGQMVNVPKNAVPQQPVSPFHAAAPALRKDSAARATEQRFEASMNRQRLSGMGAGPAASPSEGGKIPPYDPMRGPQITKDMWTEQMLTGELTTELLRNIKDPSDFINARLEKVRRPTSAKVNHLYDGTSSSINSSMLATPEQAEAMRARLQKMGLNPGPVEEVTYGGPFQIDYGDDDRRMLVINGMSVGLLLEKFARYPTEMAERKILDDWKYRNK